MNFPFLDRCRLPDFPSTSTGWKEKVLEMLPWCDKKLKKLNTEVVNSALLKYSQNIKSIIDSMGPNKILAKVHTGSATLRKS